MKTYRIASILLFSFLFISCNTDNSLKQQWKTENTESAIRNVEDTMTVETPSEFDKAETDIVCKYREGDEIAVSGTIETSEIGFCYQLKLDEPIYIEDYFLSTDILFFNWDPENLSFGTGAVCEYDGNTYPFDVFAHIGHHCTVHGSFYNYRMSGTILLSDPLIQCDICEKQDCIAFDPFYNKETDVEIDLAWQFYEELCLYFVDTYCEEGSGCEWWSNAVLKINPINHAYIGEITEENYSENMLKFQKVIDNLVQTYRLEKAGDSRLTLKIGLVFTDDNRLYFCYKK